MPTAKAQYIGDGPPWKPKEFSDELRAKIRGYFPDSTASSCPEFGHPADQFVEAVLNAAGNAAADLRRPPDLSRQEIRAECENIVKTAKELQAKLQQASWQVRRLLPPTIELQEHTENLTQVIHVLEAVDEAIDRLPPRLRPTEAHHEIAVDMAIRVLPVLKDYGMATPTTHGKYAKINDITSQSYDGKDVSQYRSVAVDILKAIGDDIGLVRSEVTWRDIISEAKTASPDLQ